MRKNLFLFIIFLSFCSLYSQTPDEIEICTALQANQFYSYSEADSALSRILNTTGLAKNFTLTPCDNINNAIAISFKGVRYILYDKKFMETISSYTNDWANLFILAHEVGHHLNGHSVDATLYKVVETKTLEAKRKQELEADEFAAFTLAKLGAPIKALLEPIELISSNEDDTFSSHPNKSKRLLAIRKGYEMYSSMSLDKSTVLVKKTIRRVDNREKWEVRDFTLDAFREWDYISNVKSVQIIDSTEVTSELITRFNVDKYFEGNYNTSLSILLETDNNFNEIIKRWLGFYSDEIKAYFSKRKVYGDYKISVYVKLDVAIDGVKFFNEELSEPKLLATYTSKDNISYEYKDDYYGRRKSIYDVVIKENSLGSLNYLSRSELDKRMTFNRFISSLKTGSSLFIQYRPYVEFIKSFNLNSTSDPKYVFQPSVSIPSLNFEFSLNGSSAALKALKLLSTD